MTSAPLSVNRDADFLDPTFLEDPFPTYRRWRAEAPVWWSERMQGWMVSRYDDVRVVLSKYKVYGQAAYFEHASVDAFGVDTLVVMNPPEHTETRRKAEPIFRPTAVEAQLAEYVERAVCELIDDIGDESEFEFTSSITTPLVMRVMAELMGTEQLDELQEWYAAIHAYTKTSRYRNADPEIEAAGRRAGAELMSYLELRGRAGHAPLYRMLMDAGIVENSALATCGLVLLAGVETTVRGLANTVYALMTHQDQLELLRADPSLATQAFDEGLRWMAPLQLKARQARQDTDLGGMAIKADDVVFPILGSANRDATHYPHADDYDITRRASDHAAFGAGIHYCVGAPVAKMEGRTVLSQLIERFPKLRLSGDPIDWDGPIYRSPRSLRLVTGR